MQILTLIFILAMAATLSLGQLSVNSDPDAARFVTSDIQLFWKAYDKATPENDLIVYRDEYLRKGSVGLKEFTRLRIGSSCSLVDTIGYAPKYYESLRGPSLKVASFEPQTRAAFRKLKEIYPAAVFPDVYFVIGRMSSAGTLSEKGLLIGVDMYGANSPGITDGLSSWHRAVLSSVDRLPYIVAHESIHYQQKYPVDAEPTLLSRSIREGAADFIAQLIAGDHINPHLHKYGDPIEKELWLEFEKEMHRTEVSNWLYQGDKAKERPADLGYYIGYKIVESYYNNAADKRRAVQDVLEIKDFNAFLSGSRYSLKFN